MPLERIERYRMARYGILNFPGKRETIRDGRLICWFLDPSLLLFRNVPAQTENFMKYHFTGTWLVLIRCEINLTLSHTYVGNDNFRSIRKCNIIAKVFVCMLVDIFYERITCIVWNISWNFISILMTLDNHWSNFKQVRKCIWKLQDIQYKYIFGRDHESI